MSCLRRAALLLLAMAACSATAKAQPYAPSPDGNTPVREVPGLDRIGVDEQLEERLPLDLEFRDHTGKEVTLADYFDGERPVLLTFAYHTCPTLCSMVLNAVSTGIEQVEWTAGVEYDVVTISIDPRDTPEAAAQKREELLERYGRPEAADGWHFLVGEEDAIEEATDAAGYRYFYNANQEQYAHPAAIMFMTPDARFARYLYGLGFDPNDIRFALLEASEGRSISTAEQLIMYCYAYDPEANGYTLMAMNVMKLGGAVTVLVLGGFLFVLWRRERRSTSAEA